MQSSQDPHPRRVTQKQEGTSQTWSPPWGAHVGHPSPGDLHQEDELPYHLDLKPAELHPGELGGYRKPRLHT